MSKEVSRKDKGVATGLCLCLGFAGAHRFYTEHHGIGLMQLVMTATGVTLLFGESGFVVAGIVLLAGNAMWILKDAASLASDNFTDAAGRLVCHSQSNSAANAVQTTKYERPILLHISDFEGLTTPTQVAINVDCSIDEAKAALQLMADKGHVEPSARHQQVAPHRASAVLVHRHELARQAVGQSGCGGESDRGHDDQQRAAGALGDRRTLLSSGSQGDR